MGDLFLALRAYSLLKSWRGPVIKSQKSLRSHAYDHFDSVPRTGVHFHYFKLHGRFMKNHHGLTSRQTKWPGPKTRLGVASRVLASFYVGECQEAGVLAKEVPVVYKIIRYVAASEIPGATPRKAGGNIAVVVDDLGNEVVMTAAQYRTQEFAKIRALELWQEVRILQPTEIHPDDFRTLYPELADLTDVEIRKRLERVGAAARTRP